MSQTVRTPMILLLCAVFAAFACAGNAWSVARVEGGECAAAGRSCGGHDEVPVDGSGDADTHHCEHTHGGVLKMVRDARCAGIEPRVSDGEMAPATAARPPEAPVFEIEHPPQLG